MISIVRNIYLNRNLKLQQVKGVDLFAAEFVTDIISTGIGQMGIEPQQYFMGAEKIFNVLIMTLKMLILTVLTSWARVLVLKVLTKIFTSWEE